MKNFVKLSVLALVLMLSAFSCSKNEAEEVKVVPPPTGCDSAAVEIPLQPQEIVDSLRYKHWREIIGDTTQWNFVVNSQQEYEQAMNKLLTRAVRFYPTIDFQKYTLLAGSIPICALYTHVVSQKLTRKCGVYSYVVVLKLNDASQPSPGRGTHFFIVEKLPPNAKVNFNVKLQGCGK